MIRVTEKTKKAFEALGCRPLVCHACAVEVEVGQVLTATEGYFVHQECKDKPITLPTDPAVKAELKKEVEAIGGLAAVLNGETGEWQSKTVTRGPGFSPEEILAVLKGSAT